MIASEPATLTPCEPLAPDTAVALYVFVPFEGCVADRLTLCAWIVEPLPIVALLLDSAELIATPTPTCVDFPPLPLLDALPSPLAVADVALPDCTVRPPPDVILRPSPMDASDEEVSRSRPNAAATPIEPLLVFADGLPVFAEPAFELGAALFAESS